MVPPGYHSHADPIWPDGTFKGLPRVADCENEKQTDHNAGQSGQDIGRPPQITGNVRLGEKTTINVVIARENPRD